MSREKYPEFVVTRTARQRPKRQTINADEDGLCEYSYITCQYCNNELELLSSSLKSCKAGVIHDHLCKCVGYTGIRPAKRGKSSDKGAKNSDESESIITTIDVANKAGHSQEWEEMKARIGSLEREAERHKLLTAQHHLWWQRGAEILGLEPPQDPPVILDAIKLLRDREASVSLINAQQMLEQKEAKETFKLVITQKDKMIEQKDETIAEEKLLIENYKMKLNDKDGELAKVIQEKQEADKVAEEADKKAQEADKKAQEADKTARDANKMAITVAARAEALQKERNALKAKFDAMLKGHEQVVRAHGKHGQSPLIKLQEWQKRAIELERLQEETAAAREFERAWARKRAHRAM